MSDNYETIKQPHALESFVSGFLFNESDNSGHPCFRAVFELTETVLEYEGKVLVGEEKKRYFGAKAELRRRELGGERMFPVMLNREEQAAEVLPYVPRKLVEARERVCRENHGQSAQRLSERGGLAPIEVYGIMHGISWGKLNGIVYSQEEMKEFLRRLNAGEEIKTFEQIRSEKDQETLEL